MDTRAITGKILDELGEWRRSSQDASDYPLAFYESLEQLLRSISGASVSPEGVDHRYHSIQELIMDCGPIDSDFLPSLGEFEVAIRAHLKS